MGSQAKIGVLTFHRCINYGSYWQARALVEGLRGLGHEAELLDHDCAHVNIAEWRCALEPTLPKRTPRNLLPRYKAKARNFFQAFARLPTSRPFPLMNPDRASRYATIIVGSDEVWNFSHPWYGGVPIFFGEGLKADRLVAYAASFGNHDATHGISDDWSGRLRRFSALSVRDCNSGALLRQALGQEPALVLDPCLQFPGASQVQVERDQPAYALIYGHGFPAWLMRRARQWSRSNHIRLVSVGYANEWADEQRIEAGPEEFARLMAGAKAVITNFFHGCIFSLRWEKPFVAAVSSYRFNKIRDLVRQLGLDRRLVDAEPSGTSLDALLEEPPGEPARQRVAEYRHRSQAFLSAALA